MEFSVHCHPCSGLSEVVSDNDDDKNDEDDDDDDNSKDIEVIEIGTGETMKMLDRLVNMEERNSLIAMTN